MPRALVRLPSLRYCNKKVCSHKTHQAPAQPLTLNRQSTLLDLSRQGGPHYSPKAKNVIVIFCAGAVSQLETWDYKPELIKQDGNRSRGGPAVTFQGPAGNLARPQYRFRPRGQTGKMVSDLIHT